VYYNAEPNESITLKRSRLYEMLEPIDRGEFFDLVVALLRKIEAGAVQTGWAGDQWDDNPIKKLPVRSPSCSFCLTFLCVSLYTNV